MEQNLAVGAHMSVAKGLHLALISGSAINCTTIQIFTRNQRQWAHKPLTDEEISLWEQAKKETGIALVMSHASYLLNLGSPNSDNLEKSRQAFAQELLRCHELGITFLNFHPGAAIDKDEKAHTRCCDKIIKSLEEIAHLVKKGETILLLETTAGQGSCVGSTFEEIGYIIHGLKKGKIFPMDKIGVCIDTCHIFAAGYDISTESGWDSTLDKFEEHIGLSYLKALHVNDSKKGCGSKRDRHASLGAEDGMIGITCFKTIMTHPKLKELPKYLETPDPTLWQEEIAKLRAFAQGAS